MSFSATMNAAQKATRPITESRDQAIDIIENGAE